MKMHYAKIYFMEFVNHTIKTAKPLEHTNLLFKLNQYILVHNNICLRLAEYFATNLEISFLFIVITTVFCTSFSLFRVSFLIFNLLMNYTLMTNIYIICYKAK